MPKKPKGEEPTQTTEQGYEIPVPKRDDVLSALRKAAKPTSTRRRRSTEK